MSENPLDDVILRTSIVIGAIVSNPEEITSMCRATMGLSRESRIRIAERVEASERLRQLRGAPRT